MKCEQSDNTKDICQKCGIKASDHKRIFQLKRTLSSPDIKKRISMIFNQQDKFEIKASLTERVMNKIGKG